MNYRTKFLGPLFLGTTGLIIAYSNGILNINEVFNGITAISLVTIATMMFSWADMK